MEDEVKIEDMKPQPAAVVEYETPVEEMGQQMGAVFAEVMTAVQRAGAQPAGMPFSMYLDMTPDERGNWHVVSGIPVSRPFEGAGRVKLGELPGGKVAVATHVGPYDRLHETYEKLDEWVREHKMKPAGPMWEIYMTDPMAEPDPAKWRTDIYYPVAE